MNVLGDTILHFCYILKSFVNHPTPTPPHPPKNPNKPKTKTKPNNPSPPQKTKPNKTKQSKAKQAKQKYPPLKKKQQLYNKQKKIKIKIRKENARN